MPDDYYRGDQQSGVSAPDLSKDCTYPEHIVRARGKRTQYTSVSLDPRRIRDFGDAVYVVIRPRLCRDNHVLREHEALMASLRVSVRASDKAERARAIQAVRYAKRRREGLIEWAFDTSGVDRKDLVTWAYGQVQEYFTKV